MAKGYPDYFGQSIWPKYGVLQEAGVNLHIVGAAPTVLLNRTGQGVLSFLEYTLHEDSALETVEFKVVVDGVTLQEDNLANLIEFGPHVGSRMPLACRYADRVGEYFMVELGREIPFGLSIYIRMLTFAGDDLFILGYSGYYNVL